MGHELWATYSVRDHCTPRALATDIMLFDRLVFPVPETAGIKGNPVKRGRVMRERNPAEWERWQKEHGILRARRGFSAGWSRSSAGYTCGIVVGGTFGIPAPEDA
jgi:hypothetical protein